MRRVLSRLSRRTSSGQFIAEIDGLRFISIALVVLFHLDAYVTAQSAAPYVVGPRADPVSGFLRHGARGVEMFFVISGFVLALPFVGQHLEGGPGVSLRAYFTRRLTRLEPPYVLAMLGTFAMVVLTTGLTAGALAPELLAHLAYVHNLVYGGSSALSAVAWSLEIEVQFYVIAPLLGALFFSLRDPVRRRLLMVGAALLAITGQLALAGAGITPPLTVLEFIQYFLAGFLLADVYVTTWRRAPGTHHAWDVVWVLAWIGMVAAWRSPSPVVAAVGTPVMTLVLYGATFRGVLVRRFFTNPWVTTMGGMCYSIYLLHYPVISAVGRVSMRWAGGRYYAADLLLQAMFVVPAVLLVSGVFFVLVERPCMDRDWPRKLRRRMGVGRERGRGGAHRPAPARGSG